MKNILSASEMKLILGGKLKNPIGCGPGVEEFTCITTYDNGFTSRGVVCAIDSDTGEQMIRDQRNKEQLGDARIKDVRCT